MNSHKRINGKACLQPITAEVINFSCLLEECCGFEAFCTRVTFSLQTNLRVRSVPAKLRRFCPWGANISPDRFIRRHISEGYILESKGREALMCMELEEAFQQFWLEAGDFQLEAVLSIINETLKYTRPAENV